MAGACECGNELSGSTRCREIPDLLKTGLLLKKDSAPWSKKGSKGKSVPLQARDAQRVPGS
jgi:hypothetical protein